LIRPDYDIVIVGGGPIGAAVAIALQGSGFAVLVLEARPDATGSGDLRTLAMSYGSRLILERLGIWSQIGPVTPIESIHVSQRSGFGRALLSAKEAKVPALGYVVRYAQLQRAFGSALGSKNTTLFAGAEVTRTQTTADGVGVEFRSLESVQSVTARLLIIADGGAGSGQRADTTVKVRDYGQKAVVGLVQTSRPHGYRAYERFTPDGPVALLPFENRYALVWVTTPETADRLSVLAPSEFLERLQQHFGDRAGRFGSIEGLACFALTLRYASNPVSPRTALLGNAAQALHPIAGQGFNLGLRDAWELAEILLRHAPLEPGLDECLSSYRAMRRPDRLGSIALTHSLVKIFSNDFALLRAARGTALSLLELVPPVKQAFMRRMIFGTAR
jgi:2-octaprenyl-6-methoxyphenol hydroxylase